MLVIFRLNPPPLLNCETNVAVAILSRDEAKLQKIKKIILCFWLKLTHSKYWSWHIAITFHGNYFLCKICHVSCKWKFLLRKFFTVFLCIYFVKLVGCKWFFKNVKKQQTTLTTFTAIFNSFSPTQAIFTVPKEPDPSCLPRVKP